MRASRLMLLAAGQRTQVRRPAVHATSVSSKGKSRFSLSDALLRDRQRIEHNRSLPWRERLKDLQVYPWKFFIAFMVLWTWLGTYVVPAMKKNHTDGSILTDKRPAPK